jgi:hypothetical protein
LTDFGEMREESAEGSSIGKKNGVMIESKAPSARNRSSIPPLAQLDEHCVIALRRKECSIAGTLDDAKSEDSVIVFERSLEIGNLESHWTEPGFGGQAIALGLHTI